MNNALTTQIQNVGLVPAVRAADLQPGQKTVWNFGYVYEVLGVERISPKFVRIAMVKIVKGQRDEKVWYRRSGNDFAVGVVS